MEYYVTTQRMSVGYQGKALIEEIELRVPKGEILTLIGPNGAGKSTILKSIAGQLQLIGGAVYLDKQALSEMSGKELSRKMAVVLTEKLRTELMTCEDVVATGRYPYTGRLGLLSAADHAAVEEAMALVHITEIREQDFTRISDGQRQRVMLARAICQQPEVIILDEPTSFLDVKYKLEFLSLLQELCRKKGMTVILSIHELELAERVSDWILCINGTCVDRFGRSEEIFQTGYIRQLFGIAVGSYDEENSSMELEAPAGKPEVFVIAGGGSGRRVFRRLQRQGIPFAAGILSANDLDYPTARALAAEIIETAAFEPVSEETLQRAKETIDRVETVICCRETFGSLEKANEALLGYAKEKGCRIETEGRQEWQK